MQWRKDKAAKDTATADSVSRDIKLSPTLEELLATCSKSGTRTSNLGFAGSSEATDVAFLLVPPEDAKKVVFAMKSSINSQSSIDIRKMNRVDASVMLHYREEAAGNVRYLFADFTISIKNLFNKMYRILANDNIEFFEVLARNGMLGIIPSEISPNDLSTDQSSIALIQMPNRQLLEELLTEVKSKVGT